MILASANMPGIDVVIALLMVALLALGYAVLAAAVDRRQERCPAPIDLAERVMRYAGLLIIAGILAVLGGAVVADIRDQRCWKYLDGQKEIRLTGKPGCGGD